MSIKFDPSDFIHVAFLKAAEAFLRGLLLRDSASLPQASIFMPPGKSMQTRRRFMMFRKVELLKVLLSVGREFVAQPAWTPEVLERLPRAMRDDEELYLLALNSAEYGVQQAGLEFPGEPSSFAKSRARRLRAALECGLREGLPVSEIARNNGVSRETAYRRLRRSG